MRCLVKGDMKEDNSGNEYRPDDEQDGGSHGELSLESECSLPS